jgi:hypothetical protein
MFRIIRMSSRRSLSPQEAFQAIEAAGGAVDAANRVPGVRSCKLYLSAGDLVFAGEYDSYAAADKILTDTGIQRTIGLLSSEFGYLVSGDEFLLEPAQVYPFLNR